MKIYWVLSYEDYYPEGDNYVASFATLEEAKEYVAAQEVDEYHNYDIVDISDRL